LLDTTIHKHLPAETPYAPDPLGRSAHLSAWGPYSKEGFGISHVPDEASGLRFDLNVFPEFYRRQVFYPAVRRDSGFRVLEASTNLHYYRVRCGMPVPQGAYADIDYCRLDAASVLVRTCLTNETDAPFLAGIHHLASVHFPTSASPGESPRIRKLKLPSSATWIDPVLDYTRLEESMHSPRSSLPPGSLRRGECLGNDLLHGRGFGGEALAKGGDQVGYSIDLGYRYTDAALVVSYRLPAGETVELELSSDALNTEPHKLRFTGSDETSRLQIDLGAIDTDRLDLRFSSEKSGSLSFVMDGIILVEKAELSQLEEADVELKPEPTIERIGEQGLLLSYENFPQAYGIAWPKIEHVVREYIGDGIETMLNETVNNHVRKRIESPGNAHHTDVFLRPFAVAPHSTVEHFHILCTGTPQEVRQQLEHFQNQSTDWAAKHQAARDTRIKLATNPAGERYLYSQMRMAANTLTNVVYPIKRRSHWIKHYCPGRWWDSLYTWDSGFTALGLAELCPKAAQSHIETYLTDEASADAAPFVHYGTPLPTQFYALQSLEHKHPSMDRLRALFPKLRQFHRFIAGREPSATIDCLQSGLLKTWDYFYNSGGWDDYPPQQYVRQTGFGSTIAPIANTAHAIRTARHLAQMAEWLGHDRTEFDADIQRLSEAIQHHAWDAETGYFGYVTHDDDGRPNGLLRTEEGENLNKGMDGLTPLIADIATEAQQAQMLKNLLSEAHLRTPIGLTTVDQSASYYRRDGYWNGAVWMPHQWLFWKTLLDFGMLDEAFRIAETALQVWQAEVARTGNCYEHFIVETGRGAGWHQFSGLSCPILNWFGTYFTPGRLSGGHNLWISQLKVSNKATQIEASLKIIGQARHAPGLIATLTPASGYEVTWNGAPLPYTERYPGTLELHLPAGNPTSDLRIQAN